VVSQGYLRNWTESRQLRLIWKNEARSPRTVLTGTRDAFVRSGFNSYVGDEGVDDSLEREWARLEGGALPVLRSIANGTVDPQDPSVVVPVKSMSAVHWVRSYALRDLTVNNYLAHEQEAIRDWPELPDLVAAFKADHDREPLPGEIADHVARGFAQRRRSNYFLIDHMVSLYNKSMAEFERFNLEVATVPVPTHDLLTSDSPN
jgi:hypothetical protein